MTLTDFLLARIAEDETAARKAWTRAWPARWDPARVLAECEAKRRIVESDRHDATDDQLVSRWLAMPYADHPDYREEWRA